MNKPSHAKAFAALAVLSDPSRLSSAMSGMDWIRRKDVPGYRARFSVGRGWGNAILSIAICTPDETDDQRVDFLREAYIERKKP